MKNVVRLAIVDPMDATRNSLKNLLLGIDMVWLEAECSRYEFFTDVAMQTQPDIALVSLDANATQGLALIAKLSQELPSCSVLVISSSQEGSLILQAMRNGAKEFLNFPLKLEDFLAALDRIQQSQGGREGDARVRSSQVYSIAGVEGGVGCTALAINIACILAQNEQNSVAILDLDLALGDADVWPIPGPKVAKELLIVGRDLKIRRQDLQSSFGRVRVVGPEIDGTLALHGVQALHVLIDLAGHPEVQGQEQQHFGNVPCGLGGQN